MTESDEPQTSQPVAYLMPVFAGGLAIIFLGEELHLYHLGGMALIVFVIWQATKKEAANPSSTFRLT